MGNKPTQLTWQRIKDFANNLTEEQLQQPLRLSTEDCNHIGVCLDVLQCDYINPSGEMAEPITDYMPGGQFHDEDIDWEDEPVVASKGEIWVIAD